MVTLFCEMITKEIEEAASVQRRRITPESFIDRYGIVNPGYINFEEFKEIYKSHVHFADDDNFMRPMPEDNKLRGLFNTLDPDQRHKISRADFARIIKDKGPQSSFLTRLRKKVIKGKDRLHNVLLEEC
jgi:Ca2+-binding EF-hand superfamily protein